MKRTLSVASVGLAVVLVDLIFSNITVSFAAIMLGFIAMALVLSKLKEIKHD